MSNFTGMAIHIQIYIRIIKQHSKVMGYKYIYKVFLFLYAISKLKDKKS